MNEQFVIHWWVAADSKPEAAVEMVVVTGWFNVPGIHVGPHTD